MQEFVPTNSSRTSRTYPVGAQEVRRAVEAAMDKLPRWEAGRSTPEEMTAVRRTRLGFRDDVSVRLTQKRTGAHTNTHVDLRSASRLGAYDFGQNKRNLAELLDAVDREMRGVTPSYSEPRDD